MKKSWLEEKVQGKEKKRIKGKIGKKGKRKIRIRKKTRKGKRESSKGEKIMGKTLVRRTEK